MSRAWLAACIVLALAGCRARGRDAPECACAGEMVVDAPLLAFLSKARAVHHEADLAQEDGDIERAIGALEAVTRGPLPRAASGELPPEAAEVAADTRARLADLRSDLGARRGDLGAIADALGDVREGLALADKPTHFRGHLFEVKGLVLERQARMLDTRGEPEAAARIKATAVEAFDSAIKIQDQVIIEALGDSGRR